MLDASARQALAVVRVLGRAGLEVGAAGYERNDLARDSRRAARSHRLPDPTSSGDAFHDALDALLERHGYDVVVATDDATIARLRERPPRVHHASRTSGPNLDALGDKVALAGVAHDAGVAYPETLVDRRLHGPRRRRPGCSGCPSSSRRRPPRASSTAGVLAHAGAVLVTTPDGLRDAAGDVRDAGLTPIAQRPAERAREDRRRARPARRAAARSGSRIASCATSRSRAASP